MDIRCSPRCSPLVGAFVVALMCAGAVPAVANDVDLRIDNRAKPGSQPTLTLKLNRAVATAVVDISSEAGHLKQQQGPGKAGSSMVFQLPQKAPGIVSWKGSLTVTFADGAGGEMPLQFQTEVLSAKFRFEVGKDDLDLENDRLTLRSERSTARVEVEVYGDADELLASSGQDFAEPIAAGAPVAVSWNPRKEADALRIHVVVFDEKGSFQSSDLFPYTITIPHEDVVFDTGSSTIRADQESRLTPALPAIQAAVTRFGPAMKAAKATVRLFVSGHTDTVGPAGSNLALSMARAKAIATWFARHGCPVQVYARGFGESMLKVETADDVDTEANRRVDYDVGVNSPTGSLTGWTLVR